MELSKFHNLECVGMIRRGDLIAEKIMRSFGINEIILINEGNFFTKLFYFLKSVKILGLKKKSSASIVNFKINQIEIGKNVYESYVRHQNKDIPKTLSYPFYRFLSKILYLNDLMKKILIKKKYTYLIQGEKYFIPFRVLFENALKQKIKIYSRAGLKNYQLKIYDNFKDRNSHRRAIDKKLVDFYYKNYKDKILLNFKNDIKKKLKKNIGAEVYQTTGLDKNFKSLQIVKNKKEICKLFNWNINDPIVLILSHVLIDGNFENKWNLFTDNIEWLEETLKKINKTDNVNWILKPHPSDDMYNAQISTEYIFHKIIKDDKKNIKLFPRNLSIKGFYKFIELVVTSHGTAGYQYPALGKQAIICGDTYYRGYNFNLEPKTKNEYFKLLANIKKIKPLKKTQIEKSIIFCYVMNVIANVEIPTIPYSDISMNYNHKKFWKESFLLLNKYKKMKSNFSRSLNFQFSNDNKNLINLEKIKFFNDKIQYCEKK